jgi:LysM repeat protein
VIQKNNGKTNTAVKTLTLVDTKSTKNADSVSYRVMQGDTAESIAFKFYQNRQMKNTILTANRLKETDLRPGVEIRLPKVQNFGFGKGEEFRQKGRKQGNISALIETYNCRGGETLDYLAHIYYRESRFAYIIATYNHKVLNHVATAGEKIQIPFKIVEMKAGETVFQIAERETNLRNYFIKMLMINRKLYPKPGDRMRVPPVKV